MTLDIAKLEEHLESLSRELDEKQRQLQTLSTEEKSMEESLREEQARKQSQRHREP